MPAPKPTTVPDWDTALLNLLTPPSGQITNGWTNGQIPPSNWFNWWMNLVGQWTDYLRDFELIAHTWTLLQTFAARLSLTDANPAATVGFTNTLLAKNLIKAWAHITTDGIGGITLVDGFNVASVQLPGASVLQVTFANPMANTNYAAVGIAQADTCPILNLIQTGLVSFLFDNLGPSPLTRLNPATTALRFTMLVIGVQ